MAGAILLAAVVVVLEAGFRAARIHGLSAWDAGAFWVPKAEALFFTGEFDAAHFGTLPNPSYPPLVPILQASAFALMGSANVIGAAPRRVVDARRRGARRRRPARTRSPARRSRGARRSSS